ncbi:MAG: 4-hydroxyphenylpyruvate dioxygenase [Gemmatimonadota bacterium]|nr:4-hydroxyphenylpyruvate dioxygenase [Gemmatimonadota bacterium]
MATTIATAQDPSVAHDTFPINGTDYIEFYVGNAKQASHFYRSAFGYELVAYRGPETGTRDRASYLLQQNKVRIVLTTPIRADGEIAEHIAKHGDGVRDIALWVDDAAEAFRLAVERGAKAVREPEVLRDDNGEVVIAAFRTYGDTIHSLVERRNYRALFMPGFQPVKSAFAPKSIGLQYVDHCVGNVELGAMNKWCQFYEEVMGFKNLISFDDTDISTEYSSLMSKVVSSGNERIKFPINEPASGKKKSQIDEYLEFYGGPGVQHVAITTNDIVSTVTALRDRGVEFLRVPTTYYDTLLDRVGHIDEDLGPLKELGILVDRDDEGYLLQIFTKPVEDRPTLFYEIIQRKGARSFGKGNFKALFEAIEREQDLRGNL